MRYSRGEHARVQALQHEVQRAEADYQRLRAAYLEIARNEPGHEVALAMIGADMDRAHAHLQALIGLPRLPYTHEPSTVVRREAERMAKQTEDHRDNKRPRNPTTSTPACSARSRTSPCW